MKKRIAFVGGGNMASCLIGGLIARGTLAASIVVAEPLATQRETLERRFGVQTKPDGADAVGEADLVVLAVKPQQMAEAARAIAPVVSMRRPLVISIAAGIRLGDLARWLGPGVPLVRTMPNLPALIDAGVSALYAGEDVNEESRADAEAILSACGRTVWVPAEDQMDVVTAVSGTGPAYFFLLIEVLQAAAVELGLDPVTARTLCLETAQGAGRMAAASGIEPAQLREQVTSKGGTTAAALEVLEAAGVRAILTRAVTAAARRSNELAREYGTI
jgi:pyrroline-5-carboxylate reductase